MIVTEKEMNKMVAEYCGYTIRAVAEMRKAEQEVTWRLLKSGHSVKYGHLGTFELIVRKGQIERDFKRPQTGEIIHLPEKPSYQKPYFRFIKDKELEIRRMSEVKFL